MTVIEIMRELVTHNPDAEVTVKVEVKGYDLPCPECTAVTEVESLTSHVNVDDVEYASGREVYLNVEVEL